MSKFYKFEQNNSGGSFDVTDTLCHRLFIEANTTLDAIQKAEDLGCYWDGVSDGRDCECCGDRWYCSSSDDGMEFPYKYGAFIAKEADELANEFGLTTEIATDKSKIYGKRNTYVIFETPEKFAQYLANYYGWTSPDARVFHLDGTINEIYKQNGKS